jgi:hypothetical protein
LKNSLWLSIVICFVASACVKTPDPWKPDGANLAGDTGSTDSAGADGENVDVFTPDLPDLESPPDVPDSPDQVEVDSFVEEIVDEVAADIADVFPDLPSDSSPEEVSPEDVVPDGTLDLLEDVPDEIVDLVVEEVAPEVVCQDACEAGTSRCYEGGLPELCAEDQSGCTSWIAGEVCGAGEVCTCKDLADAICPVDVTVCECVSECGTCGPDCPEHQDCVLDEDIGQCEWNCDSACEGKCDDGGTDSFCDCSGCDDENPCTKDECNLETDLCTFDAQALDGTVCDADNDGCTVNDTCTDGDCFPGLPADCSDLAGVCSVGSCSSVDSYSFACATEPAPAGVACEDDNYCTVGDSCAADGVCLSGGPNTCGMEEESCQQITCNPFTKTCKFEPLPDGEACDDEEVCTLQDQCAEGLCVGALNVCQPRTVSTESSYACDIDVGGPPGLAYLGSGRALATWCSGNNRVSGRFIDHNLSLTYPEIPLLDGWEPDDTDCDTKLGRSAVAARSNGDWLLATTQNVARVWRSEVNQRCNAAWNIRYSIAGYDRDGEQIAEPQSSNETSQIWYDTWKSSGGQIADYECGCDNYPDSFPKYLDINFPAISTVPDGGITTVAFADGSFGVAFWEEGSNEGFYQPVSNSFELLPLVQIDDAINIQLCVSPVSDLALMVYATGLGEVAGRFIEHEDGDTVGEFFDITTLITGQATNATCAGLADGSFVVTVSDCDEGSDCDTTLQLVDSGEGVSESGVELHTDDEGEQLPFSGPVVFADGRFVVVYHDDPFGGLASRVKARTYGSELIPEAAAKKLSPDENVPNSFPMAKLVSNTLMTVWLRTFGGVTDIVFRSTDGDGSPIFGAPEHLANRVTSGAQGAGVGVELANAEFALVWQSEGLEGGLGHDIALRRFGPTGDPLGPEIMVNSTIVGDQMDPGVAYHAATDSLLVTWTHKNVDLSTDIRGRLLSGSGEPKADDFAVSWVAQEPEDEYRSVPLFLDNGSFIVNYTGWTSIGYLEDIFAQAFAGDGTPLFTPGKVRVNYKRELRQDHVAAVQVGPMTFAAASARYSESNWSPMHISIRKLTLSVDGESGLWTFLGEPYKDDVIITEEGYPEDPAIATDGNIILVCWKALANVHCQPLAMDLQFAGAAFTVDKLGYPEYPTLAARESGSFLLAYDQIPAFGDGDMRGVVLHQLDGSGGKLFPSILANWTLAGDQSDPILVPISISELFVVGWTSNGQDGDGDGIVFRILD